ncbi:MAG: NAD(+)--dinitrogen-reductase ADP-D-ribosyltransferase [Hydrogenophilus sp.]|nr:NAD(+)--dinitrogen-reductase ADP-D-ribosyltransferase [Hydrogenophilus sp.]
MVVSKRVGGACNKESDVVEETTAVLPRSAYLPINRCNLPAAAVGSVTFQRHPLRLEIDGVRTLHARLFYALAEEPSFTARQRLFLSHMRAFFSLDSPETAGFTTSCRLDRSRAHFLRLLRGWGFDSNGVEGAVLKGWVESRFGLLPRYHGGPIRSGEDDSYRRYELMRAVGLYGANSLEAQLDLLYTFCQDELGRQRPGVHHLRLFRGSHMGAEEEVLAAPSRGRRVLLLNNLVSFTAEEERAGEFGPVVFAAEVPVAKIVCFQGLVPGLPQGEAEYLVIGGVYEVELLLA